MMNKKIAVYDSTSLAGHEILNVLAENEWGADCVIPLSAAKQSNKEFSFGDKDLKTISVDQFDFKSCDILVHADHHPSTTEIMDRAIQAGVKVIDACGHYLLSNDRGTEGQMTSFPSAIGNQLITALRPLYNVSPIKRVVISTYESTSGHGKEGMDELFNQSRKFFAHDSVGNNVFDKQIAFNVIPKTDDFMDDGQTQSEWRLNAEVKALLDPKVKLAATCVQIPSFIGNGMAVSVEFHEDAKDIDAVQAREIWRNTAGMLVIDRDSEMEFLTPAEVAGEDHIVVSRVRNDSSVDNGLSFWCVADNIRGLIALKAFETIKEL